MVEDLVKPQMKDGFGVEFWIVDENENIEKWFPEDLRGMQPLMVTNRHKALRLLVFIVDPGRTRSTDGDGTDVPVSDVTYDFVIVGPDGRIKESSKGIMGWYGQAPSARLIHIARGKQKISFETLDPLGTYTFRVVVHDNVRKVDIPVSHPIRLQDAEFHEESKKWSNTLGPIEPWGH